MIGVTPEGYAHLLDFAAAARIGGGAVYDALVALTAREASATLLTADRRAITTYRLLMVDHELVALGQELPSSLTEGPAGGAGQPCQSSSATSAAGPA